MKSIHKLLLAIITMVFALSHQPLLATGGSCSSFAIQNNTPFFIEVCIWPTGPCAAAGAWSPSITLAPGFNFFGGSLPGPYAGCCIGEVYVHTTGQAWGLQPTPNLFTLTTPLTGGFLEAGFCQLIFF